MDDTPNKGSLKGRGRDIMRGPTSDQPSSRDDGAGWLPPTGEDQGEDSPHFQDDDGLLNWLEADPEAYRPTSAPEQSLIREAQSDALYDDPDFDAIFGTSPADINPNEITQPALDALSLEDSEDEFLPDTPTLLLDRSQETGLEAIFADPDPQFDDLFGDINSEETLPSHPTLPLPQTDELLTDIMPQQDEAPTWGLQPVDSQLPDTGALTDPLPTLDDDPLEAVVPVRAASGFSIDPLESSPDDLFEPEQEFFDEATIPDDGLSLGRAESSDALFEPEPEFFDETTIPDDGGLEPAPRADRRSPEIVEDDLDMSPAPDVFEEEQAEFEGFSEEPAPGEATAILSASFDEDDTDAFGLLSEMSGEIEDDTGYAEDTYALAQPPALPEQNIELAGFRTDSGMIDAQTFVDLLEAEDSPDYDSFEEYQPETTFDTLSHYDDDSLEDYEQTDSDEPPVRLNEEALPLGEERPAPQVDLSGESLYESRLDKFIPSEPEVMEQGGLPTDLYEIEEYPVSAFNEILEADGSSEEDEIGGGTPTAPTRSAGLSLWNISKTGMTPEDPFATPEQRLSGRELFPSDTDAPPDPELLKFLVKDTRIRELFDLIETIQEEVVQNVRGERGQSDNYQAELKHAQSLLLQSTQFYDESRAMVLRVRADINREKRVLEDINRFRPLITNIYIGAGILIIVLLLLGQLFISVADSVDANWIGQGYYPALFGAIGALMFGYQTLHRHTTKLRDFDPTHINWYLMHPILGLVSGFIVYLFTWGLAITTMNDINAQVTGTSPVTWVLAVVVGYKQNLVNNLLNTFQDRISSDEDYETPTGQGGRSLR